MPDTHYPRTNDGVSFSPFRQLLVVVVVHTTHSFTQSLSHSLAPNSLAHSHRLTQVHPSKFRPSNLVMLPLAQLLQRRVVPLAQVHLPAAVRELDNLPLDARLPVARPLRPVAPAHAAQARALNQRLEPGHAKRLAQRGAPLRLRRRRRLLLLFGHGGGVVVGDQAQVLEVANVLAQQAAQRQVDEVGLAARLLGPVGQGRAAEAAEVALGVVLARVRVDAADHGVRLVGEEGERGAVVP
ncbi:hypothetical protein V8C26DRAFT_28875 [Trichoderma gracile]